MSSAYPEDTITAVATAPGRAGIGIVRVSGPDSRNIAQALLGLCPEPRLATLADFKDSDGLVLDQGIALFFEAPHSFTGEDVLELQGHGGPVVLDMVLTRVLELGARMANPGEFSQRAFLNDKLDLAQAEAISDLIDSGTRQAAAGAMRSLQGQFSSFVNELIAEVINVRVHVEAAMDFPEEEIDFFADERISTKLRDIRQSLQRLLSEAETGRLLSDGASVVLLGKPNAGKSSLMNRLTGTDASIVTAVPGTTRDIVEQQLQIDGIPLQIIDTAGIRKSGDEIEAEGVRRAMVASDRADLAIVVVDASLPDASFDLDELSGLTNVDTLVVYNKVDLLRDPNLPDDVLGVSALTGSGMESLKLAIKTRLGVETPVESGFTSRTRHLTALRAGMESLERGMRQLEIDRAGELLAEELKACQGCLSEITGEFTADDLLGEIFSSFCIGK